MVVGLLKVLGAETANEPAPVCWIVGLLPVKTSAPPLLAAMLLLLLLILRRFRLKGDAMLLVEMYPPDEPSVKSSSVELPLTGTPEGDQLPATFQSPLVGAFKLPAGPNQLEAADAVVALNASAALAARIN